MAPLDPFDATTDALSDRRQQRAPVPTLRFVFRGEAGIVHEAPIVLRPGTTRMGRIRAADAVSLEHDRLASREHARLVSHEQPRAVFIEDLQSRNGVAVNGLVVERQQLADGDVVRLGGSFLVFRFESPTQRDVPLAPLVGPSPAMQRTRMAIKRIAHEAASVLIRGATGTGKELVARALHDESQRSGRFVAVNCSAITPSLAESELFGHVAGAFTGAVHDRAGYFRSADQGTLLLDEIGDMPTELQPKLLRALETKTVTPVGSSKPVPVAVRVVAATHIDIAEEGKRGGFRPDLYARLAQLRIDLAPLSERREDILTLLEPQLDPNGPPLSVELVEALLTATWPNNVRELIAVATELRVWGRDRDRLDVDIVRERLTAPTTRRAPGDATSSQSTPRPAPLAAAQPALSEVNESQLRSLLSHHEGNVAAVAKAVGRSRTQVYRLLEKHAIDVGEFRPDP